MTFTLGNLVVFLATSVVAIILRQYDRNNRSLRQVRKYTKSVREELNQLVQERIDQVRDLTINFDVNHKRGRALVEQLNGLDSVSTEKIANYRQQCEHVEKKIDRALNSISNLDTYHKNSSEKFAHFQKNTNRIEQQFESIAKDAESLEGLRASLPTIISEQHERFQQLIDEKYAKLAKQVTESQEASREQAHLVQRVISDGLAKLQGVGEQSSKKIVSITRSFISRERKHRKTLSSHISELHSQQQAAVAEIRTEYTDQLTTLIDKERNTVSAKMERFLAQQLQQAQRVHEEKLKKWTDDNAVVHKSFLKQQEERLQELTRAVDAQMADLNETNNHALSTAHVTHDTHLQSLEELQQKLVKFHEEAEQHLHEHDAQVESLLSRQVHALQTGKEHMQAQLNTTLATLHDETTQRVSVVRDELDERIVAIGEHAEERIKTIDFQSERAEGALDEMLAVLKTRAEAEINQITQIGQELANKMATVEEQSEFLGAELDTTLSDLKAQAAKQLSGVMHEVEQSLAAMQSQSERADGAFDETLAALKVRAEQSLHEINVQLEQELSAVSSQSVRVDEELQQLEHKTNDRLALITREVSTALERAQRVQKTAQEQEQRFKDAVNGHIHTLTERVDQRVAAQFNTALEQTQQVIADAARIEEYYHTLNDKHGQLMDDQAKDFEHKIEKVVRSGAQKLDAIQKTLHSYAEKMQHDQQTTKQQFAELSAEAQRQRQQAIAKIQHEYQHRLQKQVEGLQNHLQKQSNKIDIFVNDRIERLQVHIDGRITAHREELTHAFSENTDLLEQQWKEMSVTNTRTLQELQQKEQHINDRGTHLQTLLSEMELRIDEQQESISTKVSAMHAQYQKIIEDELDQLNNTLSERGESKSIEFVQRLERMETDLNYRLESEKKRLLAVHTEEIERLVEDNVSQLQRVSVQEREDILSHQAQIREEIVESRDEIERLRENMREYGNGLQAEFADRYNEMASTTEASFKKMHDSLHGSQVKFNKEHESIIAHVNQETKRLYDELVKVQTTQRDVDEHSKSLGKAMTLQKSLSASVETLRDDVTQLATQRQEVKLVEQECVRVQDIAHKVQQALNRLNGDRRKIEMLEKNWKHLDSLSDTVERNLGKMNAKYDRVQEVQVRLRELDDLEKGVTVQYERLHNQQNIITATIEGVEKNFDNLSSIDERMQQIERDIKDLPHHVAELSEQVAVIRDNNLTSDELQQQGKRLDKMLAKLEKRMTELKSSQQWLGNLETRLQKIYSEADDKISVMHSLVRNQVPEDSPGYDDNKTSDTIKQLSRRGWTSEQISSALKVSIGEIEVVLGMATASR